MSCFDIDDSSSEARDALSSIKRNEVLEDIESFPKYVSQTDSELNLEKLYEFYTFDNANPVIPSSPRKQINEISLDEAELRPIANEKKSLDIKDLVIEPTGEKFISPNQDYKQAEGESNQELETFITFDLQKTLSLPTYNKGQWN